MQALELQAELLLAWLLKVLRGQSFLVALIEEAVTRASGFEALRKHIRVRPPTGLPDAETIVVLFATAGLPDKAQYMLGPLGVMHIKPFGK